MRPESAGRPRTPATRAGFAVALAIAVLIAVALLAALLLEAATGELRVGVAARAEARVVLAAETALAELLAIRLDSAALARPAGAVLLDERTAAPDSVRRYAQLLSPGVARLVVQVVSRLGGIRVFAGRAALVAVRPDSLGAAQARFVPLATDWLVVLP